MMSRLVMSMSILALWAIRADAGAVSFECPLQVEVKSGKVELVSELKEFRPILSGSVVNLSGLSLFSGDPDERAELKPDQIQKGGLIQEWRFEEKSSYGRTITCNYAGGVVKLAQKLSDDVSMCKSIETRNPKREIRGIRVTCQ